MFEQYEEIIRNEAIEQFPLEAVWLITESGCRLVENTHETPESFFSVSEQDTRKAMAEGLLAVVHSHPNGHAAPSASDMQGQLTTAVPWGVLSVEDGTASRIAWWGAGVEKQPLVGRKFRHGITDCYSIVKDYYELERGVQLPEKPRDWLWWQNGENLFIDDFKAAGFVRIEASEAKPGDVWLAQIRSEVPCHCGVLLEDGLTIHQAGSHQAVDDSKLSVREPVFRYSRYITHWLRYVG